VSRPRILLVDDDARMLRIVAMYLGMEGYDVTTASGGQACLDSAFTARPDIFVIDMVMPDLDGVEACRRLRAHPFTAEVPVVMFTGAPREDDVDRAGSAGANHLITKPFNLSGLTMVVRSLLPETAN